MIHVDSMGFQRMAWHDGFTGHGVVHLGLWDLTYAREGRSLRL